MRQPRVQRPISMGTHALAVCAFEHRRPYRHVTLATASTAAPGPVKTAEPATAAIPARARHRALDRRCRNVRVTAARGGEPEHVADTRGGTLPRRR